MNRTLKIVLAAIALTFGGSAMAATAAKATMADCETLMKQFDTAVTKHESAPKIKDAKDMRTAAEKLCKSGDYAKGVSDLKVALNDIGEKPVGK